MENISPKWLSSFTSLPATARLTRLFVQKTRGSDGTDELMMAEFVMWTEE